MRPRISHKLPDIRLTVGENFEENPTKYSAQAGIEPMPGRSSLSADKHTNVWATPVAIIVLNNWKIIDI